MFTSLATADPTISEADFPGTYPHQFQLTTREAKTPPGWVRTSLDGVVIDTAPDLPLVHLKGPDDHLIGIIMGLAFDQDGKKLSLVETLPSAEVSQVEQLIETLVGRYAGVISVAKAKRLYLDPVGDQAAVYNAQTKVAGSTNLFVMDEGFKENPLFHSVKFDHLLDITGLGIRGTEIRVA